MASQTTVRRSLKKRNSEAIRMIFLTLPEEAESFVVEIAPRKKAMSFFLGATRKKDDKTDAKITSIVV